MKKLFTLLIAVLCIVNLQAQENGSVTVHLGEGASLESLLAGYEKESIETVVITGTPTLDDYAYMRTQDFFNKSGYVEDVGRVMKLDMKNAAVDTIPAKAFYALEIANYQKLHIVFPKSLTFVGDSAFADCKMWFFNFEFEITGPFPKIGREPCSAEYRDNKAWCHWTVSPDNAYCVEIGEDDIEYREYWEYWGIYSADKKEFHAKSVAYDSRFEVLPGTEIISDNAFSHRELSDEVVIPESVEYIGNYAFESIGLFISSNGDVFKLGITCMRKEPPLLGKEVFADNEYFSRYIYICTRREC